MTQRKGDQGKCSLEHCFSTPAQPYHILTSHSTVLIFNQNPRLIPARDRLFFEVVSYFLVLANCLGASKNGATVISGHEGFVRDILFCRADKMLVVKSKKKKSITFLRHYVSWCIPNVFLFKISLCWSRGKDRMSNSCCSMYKDPFLKL